MDYSLDSPGNPSPLIHVVLLIINDITGYFMNLFVTLKPGLSLTVTLMLLRDLKQPKKFVKTLFVFN